MVLNVSSALFCMVGENFQNLQDNVLLLPLLWDKIVLLAF